MDRKVVVLIRHSPLNSIRNSEGLRQSVGLTLADNAVTVILLDGAAWLATSVAPEVVSGGEVKKHIQTLPLLKGRVLVERESLERHGIDQSSVMKGIEVANRDAVISEITEAGAVVAF